MSKKKLLICFGFGLFLLLVIFVIIDLSINKECTSNWLKIAELVLASSSTITLSLGLTIHYTSNKYEPKIKASQKDDGLLVQNSGEIRDIVKITNDPYIIAEAVKAIIIPAQNKNIEDICNRIIDEREKERVESAPNNDFNLKFFSDGLTISKEEIQTFGQSYMFVNQNKKTAFLRGH